LFYLSLFLLLLQAIPGVRAAGVEVLGVEIEG
jgi:hypothetical protein